MSGVNTDRMRSAVARRRMEPSFRAKTQAAYDEHLRQHFPGLWRTRRQIQAQYDHMTRVLTEAAPLQS